MMRFLLFALLTAWIASCSSTEDQASSTLPSGNPESSSGGNAGAGGTESSTATGGNGGETSTDTASISVVSGNFLGEEVLYTLDGHSGTSLSNEYLSVVALGYDGYRDHWYIFEGSNFPVTAAQRGRLHIRRFDLEAHSWVSINVLENILLPRSPRDFVVLKDAVAYLSDRETANGNDLVVLNTANPESVQLLVPETYNVSPSVNNRSVMGLMGSSPSLQSLHFINVLKRQDLGSGACALYVHHHTLKNNQITSSPSAELMVASYACVNSPSWVADPLTEGQLLLLPPAAEQQDGSALRFHAETLTIQAQYPFTLPSHRAAHSFERAVIDPCAQIAMVAEVGNPPTLHAIPISSNSFSAVGSVEMNHVADTLGYTRADHRILVGYADGNEFGIPAYHLSGTCNTPQLKPLDPPAWTPPVSLVPRIVVRPQTLPLDCPDPCSL